MWFKPRPLAIAATALATVLASPAAKAIVIDFEDVLTPPLAPLAEQVFGTPDFPALQVSRGFNFDWVEIPLGPNVLTHGHLSRAGASDGDAWVWTPSNDPANPNLSTTYAVTDDSIFQNINNTLTITEVGFVPAASNSLQTSDHDDDDDDDDNTGGGTPPTPATGFSIQSFDVAEAFSSARSAQQVLVEGFLDDGDELVDLTLTVGLDEDFTVDPTVPKTTAFQTVQFGPEWAGLKRIVFDGLGSQQTSSDYFAVDNIVVNEPVIVDPPPDDPNDPIGVSEPSGLAGFGFGAFLLGWMARRRNAARASSLVRIVKKC